MSVLCVGISHRSAPVTTLEQVALDPEGAAKLAGAVADSAHVREVTVLATCNRVEIYADVDRFHGAVEDLSGLLSDRSGQPRDAITPSLYVHYDDAAVAHLFAVAAGLDSMVVGEAQVLGQVRQALLRGQEAGTVGPTLNLCFQQALRVGKRAHAETGIDRAGQSLVSVAIDAAEPRLGGLAGRRALVVGAGAMAGLTVATLGRRGVDDITVCNRTPARAARLAASSGGRAVDWGALGAELIRADLVVSCTGSTGVVLPLDLVLPAVSRRTPDRPLVVVDLALPRDLDPAVADLPGVSVLGLGELAQQVGDGETAAEIEAVRQIVADELAAFASARRAASVAPTVVALRSMATDVVDTETRRLAARLPDLPPQHWAEVERTIRRVADKLLHAPTVRIKELAANPDAVSYTDALTALFALDPAAVDAVTRPDVDPAGEAP